MILFMRKLFFFAKLMHKCEKKFKASTSFNHVRIREHHKFMFLFLSNKILCDHT